MPLLLMPNTDVYVTNAVEEADFEKRKPAWIYYNRIISDEVLRLQSKYHFRVAVDVDDWWHLDPHHIMFRYSKTNNGAAHAVKHLRIADVVTCTHERLAERVYEFNKNVVVLPNAIPEERTWVSAAPSTEKYPFPVERTKSANGHKRIFWQGSVTHEKDIELLRQTVKYLDKECFMMVMAGYTNQIEWERMADCYTNYKKMPGVVLPGLLPTEYYRNYKYADVCVVPILSTKFNCYKSNLKILEAAHSGLPVIASNVHPYKNIPGLMYAEKKSDWLAWLLNQDAWADHAERLAKHCQREYNFETINLNRATIFN